MPSGAAHQIARRPSPWWSSRYMTNDRLPPMKNVGWPWLSRSVVSGRARQSSRMRSSGLRWTFGPMTWSERIHQDSMGTYVRMYVELHCHSAYSFLDGASMPDELVPAALELGHRALALTDHNSVSGSMELAQAARGLGLRAIHGAE